ncbi:MAG: DoxX family protein [Candidatus Acidiferrales bacterium]|jgi:putative oxidoreductase
MSDARNQILRMYDGFVRAASSLQSPFLFLFVRLYWGWEFMEDGWGKLHNLAKVTEYFASLNLPAPGQTALFVSIIELVGGMLLVLGLFSRLTALVLTVNMLTAYVTGDREALLSVFTAPDKFSAAAPYMYLFASLVVLIFGPGKFALDTLLDRMIRKREYSAPGDSGSSGT